MRRVRYYVGAGAVLGLAGCFDAPATPRTEETSPTFYTLPRTDAGSGESVRPTNQVPCAVAPQPTATGGSADGANTTSHPDGGIDPFDDMADTFADAAMTDVLPKPAAAQVRINEVMANPSGRPDSAGEWIELINLADVTLDLSGCSLGSGESSDPVLAGPLPIEPGRPLVVARSADPGFVPDAVLTMSLRNSDDRVVLRCAGVTVDGFAYGSSDGLAVPTGASLQRDPLSRDSLFCVAQDDYGGDLGTPGTANTPCTSTDQDAGI